MAVADVFCTARCRCDSHQTCWYGVTKSREEIQRHIHQNVKHNRSGSCDLRWSYFFSVVVNDNVVQSAVREDSVNLWPAFDG